LPSRSPELNPVENVWQYLRQNWLSNSVFEDYQAILDAGCDAWNKLIAKPSPKPSCPSDFVTGPMPVNNSCRWYELLRRLATYCRKIFISQ
jgi:hypothetical protein